MMTIPFSRRFLVLAGALAAGTALTPAPAAAQDFACNTEYVAQEGDYLFGIAARASARLGVTVTVQDLTDFNSTVIDDPDMIRPGMEIYIPCPGGPGEGTDVALADAGGDDIAILTGKEYAPYVDEGLLEGGMSRHLLEAALQARGATDYSITAIGDWSSHLRDLLAAGRFDLAFPWYEPDCEAYDNLSDEGQWRCDNLEFSEPINEVVVAHYGRVGEVESLFEASDMEGKRVCRPEGYFLHDLYASGILPAARLVAPDSPQACFEMLLEGEVDTVTLNERTAEAALAELDAADEVAQARDLATIEDLTVVGMNTNPDIRTLMLRVDQGLSRIARDGTRRAIMQQHLSQ